MSMGAAPAAVSLPGVRGSSGAPRYEYATVADESEGAEGEGTAGGVGRLSSLQDE